MISVIGVDPGDSCGLANVAYLPERDEVVILHRYQGPPDGMLDLLRTLLTASVAARDDDDVIVACERFNQVGQPGRRSAQTTAQQVVGTVRYVCRECDVRLVMQDPASARGIASDAFLRSVDLWTTPSQVNCGDADDVNMATRHAVLALACHRATIFARLTTHG